MCVCRCNDNSSRFIQKVAHEDIEDEYLSEKYSKDKEGMAGRKSPSPTRRPPTSAMPGQSTPKRIKQDEQSAEEILGADCDLEDDWGDCVSQTLKSAGGSIDASSHVSPKKQKVAASPQAASPSPFAASPASQLDSPAKPSPGPKATQRVPLSPASLLSSKGSRTSAGKKGFPAGHNKCKCCNEILQESFYCEGRAVCKEDDLATEALQRVLRKRWGKQYKSNLKKAKSNQESWNRAIVCVRSANKSNGKRMLSQAGQAQDTLQKAKQKGKKRIRRTARRKITYQAFSLYHSDIAHGGDKPEALRTNWDECVKGIPKADDKGVVDGVPGFARFRVSLEDADDSFSNSESGSVAQHVLSTKPGHASMQDIVDFLNGDSVIEMPGDIEVPQELDEIGQQPKQKKKAALAAPAGPAADQDLDGELDDEADHVKAFLYWGVGSYSAWTCLCSPFPMTYFPQHLFERQSRQFCPKIIARSIQCALPILLIPYCLATSRSTNAT